MVLKYRTGYYFKTGLAVMVSLIPTSAKIMTIANKLQTKQMKIKDKRMKKLNELISGIMVIKANAWEIHFEEEVLEIRKNEVSLLKQAAFFQSLYTTLWLLSPILVTISAFTAYTCISGLPLSAEVAFVSMNLFNLIKQPLNAFPSFVSKFVNCHVSMKRLREYFTTDDLPTRPQSLMDEFALVMSKASFSWGSSMMPILKNITLHISEGKLTIVVGPVGGGKSSLLCAILGEMNKLSGTYGFKGSLSYVTQQPWIQNMSLRDNILFGKDYNETKYRKVIQSCSLVHDFNNLPAGDLTEIGEKGLNLSGGQKQRVSLARAIYQRANLVLLDDPLSALDSRVASQVFNQVIGPRGILRNKTRVLVTHGVHWLPIADCILFIDRGYLVDVGTYAQLLHSNGPFAQYLRTNTNEYDNDRLYEQPPPAPMSSLFSSEEEVHFSQSEKRLESNSKSFEDLRCRKSRNSTHTETMVTNPQKDNAHRTMKDEKVEGGKVRKYVVKTTIQTFGYMAAMLVLVFLMLATALHVTTGVWVSVWTDNVKIQNRTGDGTETDSSTTNYLCIFVLLTVLQIIVNAVFVTLLLIQFVNMSNHLHNKILNCILHQPMMFFDTTRSGIILNRFSGDINVLDTSLAGLIRVTLHTVSNLISSLVVISYATKVFALAVLPILSIYIGFQIFYSPASVQLRRLDSTSRSPIISLFTESLDGALSIRAYGATSRFIRQFWGLLDSTFKISFANIMILRWLRVRLELLGNLIVLLASCLAVFSDISESLVALSITYALQLTSVFNILVQSVSRLEANFVHVERVIEYCHLIHEPPWIVMKKRPMVTWPERGEIRFDNYCTQYRPGLELVLKDVSFTIMGGEKIGIVGRTGAGKSSLTLALFRMLEAHSGRILLDGLDISTIGLHDLRAKLTLLPQDPFIFSGSLRFNLDPLEIHTDGDIYDAIQLAGLTDQDIAPALDFICEERGRNLSVGQQQQICLARGLLRRTKVVVLDEATASVDFDKDCYIKKSLMGALCDCTVLIVAHRLQSVMDCDRILVFADGRPVEFGSPQELLSDVHSHFYLLNLHSQTG